MRRYRFVGSEAARLAEKLPVRPNPGCLPAWSCVYYLLTAPSPPGRMGDMFLKRFPSRSRGAWPRSLVDEHFPSGDRSGRRPTVWGPRRPLLLDDPQGILGRICIGSPVESPGDLEVRIFEFLRAPMCTLRWGNKMCARLHLPRTSRDRRGPRRLGKPTSLRSMIRRGPKVNHLSRPWVH